MFSVTPSEVLVIVVIALIIFGPGRLVEVSRKAGQIAGQLRRQAEELKAGLDEELGDLKELGELKNLGGLKEVTSSIEDDVKEITKPFREAGTDLAAAGKALEETAEGELKWVDAPLQDDDDLDGDVVDDDRDDGSREPDDADDLAEPGDG